MKTEFFDIASTSPHYLDLRASQDDKRILRNPHKGWGVHYIDNGIERPIYRNTIAEGDTLRDFPYLNHMYLRFDWGDIEKADGVCDWEYIDSIFEKWSKLDYRFSIRICTYEGLDDHICYPTPKWVFDKGAKFHDIDGVIEPVYDDPIYLEYLDRFLGECAKKFDGNPLVELVDVGTFGTWGEGHTGYGSNVCYPHSTIFKHIELHLKNFRKTPVLFNDDIARHATWQFHEPPQEIVDFCSEHGCGLRDDSILYEYGFDNCGYDTLLCPSMFDQFWKNAPIDIEFTHLTMTDEANYRSGFTCAAALERTHATFSVFHGCPRDWLAKYYDLTVYAGARLGYWYMPTGIIIPESISGITSCAEFTVYNKGWGLGYFDGDLEFTLKDEGGKIYNICRTPANNKLWMPGKKTNVRANLDFGNVPAGNYQLSLGLLEGDRPIEFGFLEEKTENGRIILDNITVR